MSSIVNNHQELATFMDYLPVNNGAGGGSGATTGNNNIGSDTSTKEEGETSASRLADGASSHNGDSGYNSEISDSASDGGTGDSSFEPDEFEDMHERIEFIQAKQEILGKANEILFDYEDLLTAETATKNQQAGVRAAEGSEGEGEYNSTSSLSSLDSPPTIWKEAREILHKINHSSGDHSSLPPASLHQPRTIQHRNAPNPRHPSIPMLGVKRLASSVFAEETSTKVSQSDESSNLVVIPKGTTTVKSKVVSLFGAQAGHWMAQALIRSASTSSTRVGRKRLREDGTESERSVSPSGDESDWKVIPSSAERPLDMLLPPPGRLFRHASVDMNTATTPQTEQARLVTQATPPFLVVYANRAFLQMTGCKGKSNETPNKSFEAGIPSNLIGQPVESLIQVVSGLHDSERIDDASEDQGEQESLNRPHEADQDENPNDPCFESILVQNGRPCQIQIVPVVDRSFSSRYTRNVKNTDPSSCCMSHLMVQVISSPKPAHASTTFSSQRSPFFSRSDLIHPKALRIVVAPQQAREDSREESSASDSSSDEKSGVLGTVG
eukprot:CAMPEP_0172440172 /NCGR_PEP_ID=MMETSP1065-20121228/898_1 /TAXON_ID=265537 /ORGANISM="Amphiprora paludosa, Strain CCMP125" /LENGTH=553 /DNA_ID=CAMNT_0013188955 /DNA_START=52 /DNA_END=1713 /DNA_ORIENTATION=+